MRTSQGDRADSAPPTLVLQPSKELKNLHRVPLKTAGRPRWARFPSLAILRGSARTTPASVYQPQRISVILTIRICNDPGIGSRPVCQDLCNDAGNSLGWCACSTLGQPEQLMSAS